jgi:hypothetical protein
MLTLALALAGSLATASDAPRPFFPASAARVSTTQPTFRFVSPPGTVFAIVEICADRACTLPEGVALGFAGEAPALFPLAPGVHYWRVHAIVASASDGGGVSLIDRTGPTWQLRVGYGDALVESSGLPLSDFDGDGFEDIVVTRPTTLLPGNLGAVLEVHRGGPDGVELTPQVSVPLASFAPQSMLLPRRLVGDVDGDGFADVVVPLVEFPPPEDPEGPYPGPLYRPYVIPGGAGGLDPARAIGLAPPALGLAWIGFLGDTDGDGFADLMQSGPTGTWVFPGGPDGPGTPHLVGAGTPGSFLSHGVALGDVDGDGLADLGIVSGEIEPMSGISSLTLDVYLGSPAGLGSTPAQILPLGNNAFFLDGSGADLDGDGYADVVSAAGNILGADMPIVTYLGGPAGLSPYPMQRVTAPLVGQFPAIPLVLGDANRDGADEVVGLLSRTTPTGFSTELITVWGGTEGLEDDGARREDVTTSIFAVIPLFPMPVGDVDGDGRDDLVLMGEPPRLLRGAAGPGEPLDFAWLSGCMPGQMRACYTGPMETMAHGTCSSGSQTCLDDGGGWGACEGEILPADDLPGDGLDQDCDDQTDEAPGTPPPGPIVRSAAGVAKLDVALPRVYLQVNPAASGNEVRVYGTLISGEGLPPRPLDDGLVDVEKHGSVMRVRPGPTTLGEWDTLVVWITAPRHLALAIDVGEGEVVAQGFLGKIVAHTEQAQLHVRAMSGDARLTCERCQVIVARIDGDLDVRVGDGFLFAELGSVDSGTHRLRVDHGELFLGLGGSADARVKIVADPARVQSVFPVQNGRVRLGAETARITARVNEGNLVLP